MHYFQLIAAIPPDSKRKAFGSMVPDLLGATSEYCHMEDRKIVLTKFGRKNYYSLFIEKLVSEPSAVRAWEKNTSVKRTARVGPCLCLFPLFDSL